jgi:cell division protein FtsQ
VAALAGLLVAAALGGWQGWRFLTTGESLKIREIRFTGLRGADADELLERSPVKRGDNLVLADVDAMARALLRDPWVAEAEVRRRWPPALEVVVREREAAALVDLGGLYLADAGGRVFKRAGAGDGLDLPLVTGFAADDYVKRRADVEAGLRGALRLASAWADAGLDRSLPLAEIHLDFVDGVTVYAGEEGVQVRLGADDPAPKLARLRTVLATLRAEGKRAEIIHLDNRTHPSWVTVRPRGGGRTTEGAGG